MLESRCQLVGTLSRRVTMRHKSPNLLSHLPLPFGLVNAAFRHGLLKFLDILPQWVENLSDTLVAGLRKLLLTLLKHIARLRLHLCRHLRQSLVKTLLQRCKRLTMILFAQVNVFLMLLSKILLNRLNGIDRIHLSLRSSFLEGVGAGLRILELGLQLRAFGVKLGEQAVLGVSLDLTDFASIYYYGGNRSYHDSCNE